MQGIGKTIINLIIIASIFYKVGAEASSKQSKIVLVNISLEELEYSMRGNNNTLKCIHSKNAYKMIKTYKKELRKSEPNHNWEDINKYIELITIRYCE
tara:strand:+ start:440 stop:733 length:294 start_codon:yes stop_codon:yes gene_type:complete